MILPILAVYAIVGFAFFLGLFFSSLDNGKLAFGKALIWPILAVFHCVVAIRMAFRDMLADW